MKGPAAGGIGAFDMESPVTLSFERPDKENPEQMKIVKAGKKAKSHMGNDGMVEFDTVEFHPPTVLGHYGHYTFAAKTKSGTSWTGELAATEAELDHSGTITLTRKDSRFLEGKAVIDGITYEITTREDEVKDPDSSHIWQVDQMCAKALLIDPQAK